MAKFNARGCYKVKGYVFKALPTEFDREDEEHEITYALRSDGAVLVKCDRITWYYGNRSRQSGGYSIVGTLKDKANIRQNFEGWIEHKIVPKYGPALRTAR